jgi:excisionase family DNA binding protein
MANHQPPPIALLTPREAAAQLRISERQLRELVAAGLLPCVKINTRVRRFTQASLNNFVKACTDE